MFFVAKISIRLSPFSPAAHNNIRNRYDCVDRRITNRRSYLYASLGRNKFYSTAGLCWKEVLVVDLESDVLLDLGLVVVLGPAQEGLHQALIRLPDAEGHCGLYELKQC